MQRTPTVALYPVWANTVYRAAIATLLLGALAAIVVPWLYVRTTYNTSQFVPWDQPVEFDHRHHVRDDGIDCLYCHRTAETGPSAGVPSTGVCMGCHAQIWNDSPLLETVRRSYFTNRPIDWKRVHDLPDHVYFDHSVHVARGIGCESCHGDVGQMARVMQTQPLTMGWCLDCHRDSAVRVARRVPPTNTWEASVDMLFDLPSSDRRVTGLTTCTACHR